MITLAPLPYDKKALEPHISERTLDFHYSKHHQAYVNNLNNLIAGTDMMDASLESLIIWSQDNVDLAGVFNNAAQVWNHTFYWNSLSAQGGAPQGDLKTALEASFGSIEGFNQAFKTAATSQFGSGWAWLVTDRAGNVSIMKTSNAQTPLTHPEKKPLLTCDVWEHAYYLDYQNRRPDYVDTCITHLLNWNFAQENYAKR